MTSVTELTHDRTRRVSPNVKSRIGAALHEAFREFNERWVESVVGVKSLKIKELQHLFTMIRGTLIAKYSMDPVLKRELRQLLKAYIKVIMGKAREITETSVFAPQRLVYEFFGGRPKFEFPVQCETIKGQCDIVAQSEFGELIIWDLKTGKVPKAEPYKPYLLQVGLYGLLAEKSLGGTCKELVLLYKDGSTHRRPFNDDFREDIEVFLEAKLDDARQVPAPESEVIVDTGDVLSAQKIHLIKEDAPQSVDSEVQDIGWVLYDEKNPLITSITKNQVTGYLKGDWAPKVEAGSCVIVYSLEEPNQYYCRVIKIHGYNKSAKIVTKETRENVFKIEMELIIEVDGAYEGPPRQNPLINFRIRFPQERELRFFHGLASHGVPLGYIPINYETEIPYFYPESRIFQSMFVCGVQNSGKTNFIRMLIRAFSSRVNVATKDLPAIVIFDVEEEFTQIDSEIFQNPVTSERLRELGISDQVSIDIRTFGEGGISTISASELNPEDLAYFVPQLEEKSQEFFTRYVQVAHAELSGSGAYTLQALLELVQAQARTDRILSAPQRTAIMRACLANNFDLFDEPGKDPIQVADLIQPGKVTVINLYPLSEVEQRTIALYLLILFNNHQFRSFRQSKLITIIDEAHRLFPNRPTGELNIGYIARLNRKIYDVTHRGRKRNYGIVFATQSPSDISSTSIDLCNTKLVLRTSGHKRWLRDHVESQLIPKITKLLVGTGYIVCKGNHEPLLIKIPNLSDI